ncbi:MAG: glycerate kinase [Ruminococcaceae bacterium]|nr:glycerate kinase [Oscillospiraceae bacterium]
MKVVIAIDSFKGSLSTFASAEAVKEGIHAVDASAEVEICPLADGGEGTVAAVVGATGGTLSTVTVTGPLGEKVSAEYGVIPASKTAVIEMAAAAGITLVPAHLRDPLLTTTYGVGELILHAIRENGCRNFLIGIGGSATNDGGVGMLRALGFRFLDAEGKDIPHGACGLDLLKKIDIKGVLPELKDCKFEIACDVKNPLCGKNGCSAVYGPQKGATPETVKSMDAALSAYADLTAQTLGRADAEYPGAGAAGGMGFAFLSYLNADLVSGIELVMRVTHLEEKLKDADLVVTGEGRLDAQSCMGKAPVGVARAAKKYGKPVIAFCGCASEDASLCNQNGIDAFFPILQTPCTVAAAMDLPTAHFNLKTTAEQVFRLITSMRR